MLWVLCSHFWENVQSNLTSISLDKMVQCLFNIKAVLLFFMYFSCLCVYITVQPPLLLCSSLCPLHTPCFSYPSVSSLPFPGEQHGLQFCVIWILTSVSVYKPDSWDVVAQKSLFSFPSMSVDFYSPSSLFISKLATQAHCWVKTWCSANHLISA